MRVLLNTEAMVPSSPEGGYYTHGLHQAMKALPGLELQCWDGPAGFRAGQTLARRVSCLCKFSWAPGFSRLWCWCREREFTSVARKLRLGTLYHEPNGILLPYDGPSVATIQDLSPIHHPGWHPAALCRLYERKLPKAVKMASLLIAFSEYSRRDLAQTFGVAPEKIVVIPPGVDHAVFYPRGGSEGLRPLGRYHLSPGRYILSPATLDAGKNLEGLFTAYARLPPALRQQYPLFLARTSGRHAESLKSQVESLRRQGLDIRCPNYVPLSELPALYSGALAMVFPALEDGFGLQPLEAMACGCPVIAHYSGALPETLGNAAIFAKDDGALALGIESLVEDDLLRKRFVAIAKVRATSYSWERTAKETLDAYKKAMGLVR